MAGCWVWEMGAEDLDQWAGRSRSMRKSGGPSSTSTNFAAEGEILWGGQNVLGRTEIWQLFRASTSSDGKWLEHNLRLRTRKAVPLDEERPQQRLHVRLYCSTGRQGPLAFPLERRKASSSMGGRSWCWGPTTTAHGTGWLQPVGCPGRKAFPVKRVVHLNCSKARAIRFRLPVTLSRNGHCF